MQLDIKTMQMAVKSEKLSWRRKLDEGVRNFGHVLHNKKIWLWDTQ